MTGFRVLLILCVFSIVHGIAAEEGQAILSRGPLVGKGIEYLPPNALPYEKGEYRYRDGIVTVYFFRTFVPVLAGWTADACGRTALSRIPAPRNSEETVFFHDSQDGWQVILSFPKGEDRFCPFITAFLTRLRFFLGTAGGSGSPLPAIVEIK